jgi:hypothetical protein
MRIGILHMINKDDLRFRHLIRRTTFPRSFRSALELWPEFPNTLPPQDLNRDAELGRVGCSLRCIPCTSGSVCDK